MNHTPGGAISLVFASSWMALHQQCIEGEGNPWRFQLKAAKTIALRKTTIQRKGQLTILGGGQLKYFWNFPPKIGEDSHFDGQIWGDQFCRRHLWLSKGIPKKKSSFDSRLGMILSICLGHSKNLEEKFRTSVFGWCKVFGPCVIQIFVTKKCWNCTWWSCVEKVTKVHAESWGHAIVAVTQLYALLLKNLKDVWK